MGDSRCPSCGYSEEDAQINGDHRLCKNAGNAPWEKKADRRASSPVVSETGVQREELLQQTALQLDLALGEIRLIDEALARRPALADLSTTQRYEKIMRMCDYAAKGHALAKQEPDEAASVLTEGQRTCEHAGKDWYMYGCSECIRVSSGICRQWKIDDDEASHPQDERERFEEAFRGRFPSTAFMLLESWNGEIYVDPKVQTCWTWWQAALASRIRK